MREIVLVPFPTASIFPVALRMGQAVWGKDREALGREAEDPRDAVVMPHLVE